MQNSSKRPADKWPPCPWRIKLACRSSHTAIDASSSVAGPKREEALPSRPRLAQSLVRSSGASLPASRRRNPVRHHARLWRAKSVVTILSLGRCFLQQRFRQKAPVPFPLSLVIPESVSQDRPFARWRLQSVACSAPSPSLLSLRSASGRGLRDVGSLRTCYLSPFVVSSQWVVTRLLQSEST